VTTRLNPSQKRTDDMHANGIRVNRSQEFNLRLMGYELYDILEVLESVASKGGPYLEVSKAVLAAETLRERAKEAGF
jgi:hypothetical protein